ncbi:hypothetical protein SCUP515_03509 [Seiridium cupressi]
MSQEYEALPQAESACPSTLANEVNPLLKRQATWPPWVVRFWVTATVLFALLSAWLGWQLNLVHHRSSFAQGFEHELDAAKHWVRIEERVFQGSPRFTENGTEYVPEPADGKPRTQYVGDPTKEIDAAWDRLHEGRFFLLTENEAMDAWGPGYEQFYAPRAGGYSTDLSYPRAPFLYPMAI